MKNEKERKYPQKNNNIDLIPRCLHCGLNPIPPALRVMRTNARGIRRPDACICKTCANFKAYQNRWNRREIEEMEMEIKKLTWKISALKLLLRKRNAPIKERRAEDTIVSGVNKNKKSI